MTKGQQELSHAAENWLHDNCTIVEAVPWIEAHGTIAEPLRALKSELTSGRVRSNGEVDGTRRDLSIADWIDFAIYRTRSDTIEVRSIRTYPRKLVQKPTHQVTAQLNGRIARFPLYHRTIEGVLLSAGDVRRVWPAEIPGEEPEAKIDAPELDPPGTRSTSEGNAHGVGRIRQGQMERLVAAEFRGPVPANVSAPERNRRLNERAKLLELVSFPGTEWRKFFLVNRPDLQKQF